MEGVLRLEVSRTWGWGRSWFKTSDSIALLNDEARGTSYREFFPARRSFLPKVASDWSEIGVPLCPVFLSPCLFLEAHHLSHSVKHHPGAAVCLAPAPLLSDCLLCPHLPVGLSTCVFSWMGTPTGTSVISPADKKTGCRGTPRWKVWGRGQSHQGRQRKKRNMR